MTFGNFIAGMRILDNYCDDESVPLSAEHDEFFVSPPLPVAEEDAERLEELGWSFVAEHGSWRAFV